MKYNSSITQITLKDNFVLMKQQMESYPQILLDHLQIM